MNVTFLAFVRHEEHLLLLKRLASDADFPALWDGVYGSGEDDAAVLDAVVTATGIVCGEPGRPAIRRRRGHRHRRSIQRRDPCAGRGHHR